MDTNGQMITVKSGDGQKRQTFNEFHVKLYYTDYFENLFASKCHLHVISIYSRAYLTEVIETHDERLLKFNKAKKKEIDRLPARKTLGSCFL